MIPRWLPGLADRAVPPLPEEVQRPVLRDRPEDELRWAYTHWRRRILYGLHRPLVEAHLRHALGSPRAADWSVCDMSTNLAATVCDSVSVLYQRKPRVLFLDAEGAIAGTVAREAQALGAWTMLQRVARDCLGLRDVLVRVSVARGRVVLRPVRPDLVTVDVEDDDPSRPVVLREYRWRNERWEVDVHDIRNPESPSARVEDAEGGVVRVVSSGATYPWRSDDGSPIIPYAWYHASRTGGVWDPYEWHRLFEATLTSGLLRSFYLHTVQTASWKQRYGMNVEAVGAQGTVGERELTADPAMMIMFRTPMDTPSSVSQVGTLDVPTDAQALLQSVERYEHAAVSGVGLPAAELLRTGGDPRSGVALAVAEEGQRAVQRRFVPQLAAGDAELMGLIAAAINATTGLTLPTSGYTVVHPGFEDVVGARPVPVTIDDVAAAAVTAGDLATASYALQVSATQARESAEAEGNDEEVDNG